MPEPFRCGYRFARGWLAWLETGPLRAVLARDLAGEPEARLLRHLTIGDLYSFVYGPTPEGDEGEGEDLLKVLAESPYLGNVRILDLGTGSAYEDELGALQYNTWADLPSFGVYTWRLVERMQRLEELRVWGWLHSLEWLFRLKTLTNLRTLEVRLADEYPLEVLARNPALKNLTRLFLQPRAHAEGDDPITVFLPLSGFKAVLRSPNLPALTHLHVRQTDVGDKGCRAVSSGILKRLKVLDLARGCITDAGACTLAACPDLKNLERLDVSCNALTQEGIERLRGTGIQVRAGDQHAEGDTHYLFEGEME